MPLGRLIFQQEEPDAFIQSQANDMLPSPSISRVIEKVRESGAHGGFLGGMERLARKWEANDPYPRTESETPWLDVYGRGDPAKGVKPEYRLLQPKEANELYGLPGMKPFTEPVSEQAALIAQSWHKQKTDLDAVLDRTTGVATAAKWGGLFAVGAFDPVELTAMLAPVGPLVAKTPFVGTVLSNMFRAGFSASLPARMGGRAALGATEGLVGQALVEPLGFYLDDQMQQDHGAAVILSNLVFGAALGSALHVGGGTFKDAFDHYTRKGLDTVLPSWLTPMREDTHLAAVEASVAQMTNGTRPEVEPIVRSDPAHAVVEPTHHAADTDSNVATSISQYVTAENKSMAAQTFVNYARGKTSSFEVNAHGVKIGEHQTKMPFDVVEGLALNSVSFIREDAPHYTEPSKVKSGKIFYDTNNDNKVKSSGLIIREPDGRVWVIRPKNGYAGVTFPKGQINPGESRLNAAAREVFEETGLTADITRDLGAVARDHSFTRYHLATRRGGMPKLNDEVEGIMLVTLDELEKLVSTEADKKIIKGLRDLDIVKKSVGSQAAFSMSPFTNFATKLFGRKILDWMGKIEVSQETIDAGELTMAGNAQPLGSNPGGIATTPDGSVYYVKAMTPERAQNEYAASLFYRDLFPDLTPPMKVVEAPNGTEVGVASAWEANSVTVSPKSIIDRKGELEHKYGVSGLTDAELKEYDSIHRLQQAYVLSAFLGNWDAYVQGNLIRREDGTYAMIDYGGALLYRAQGAEKGLTFTTFDSDFESMMNNPFTQHLDTDNLSEGARKLFASVNKEKIRDFVYGAGFTGQKAEDLVSKLISRLESYKKRFPDEAEAVSHNMGVYNFSTTKSAKKWLLDKAAELHSLYTKEERVAMENYQGSSSGLNKALRKGNGAEIEEYYTKTIEAMDAAMDKYSLEKAAVLHRWDIGHYYTDAATGEKLTFENHASWKGKVFTDLGYISSSLGEKNGFHTGHDRNVHIVYHAPVGTKGVIPKAHEANPSTGGFASETEFVMKRGMSFYVVSSEVKYLHGRDVIELHVEVQPEGARGAPSPEELFNAVHDYHTKAESVAEDPTPVVDAAEAAAHINELLTPEIPTLTEVIKPKWQAALEAEIAEQEAILKQSFGEGYELPAMTSRNIEENLKQAEAYGTAFREAWKCYNG